MNFIDRVFCLVLGHVWERVWGIDAVRCPHCTKQFTALEQIAWQRKRRFWIISDRVALMLPRPKRVW